MADRVIMPRALDDAGAVVSDAVAYFYATGTTTPLTVYSDSDGLTPLGVSVEADATGVFPAVFSTSALRMDIQDGDSVSLTGFPSDSWYVTPNAGTAASTITFSPITGNAAADVQTAIGNLTALWNAVSTYGKSLIAAVDAAAARTSLGLGGLATLDILDEDDFATDSATRPPSQQSTKAYVDATVVSVPIIVAAGHITYTAGVPALTGDFGVASITDTSTGRLGIVFTTAEADVDKYHVFLSLIAGTGDVRSTLSVVDSEKLTTGFGTQSLDVNAGLVDRDFMFHVIRVP